MFLDGTHSDMAFTSTRPNGRYRSHWVICVLDAVHQVRRSGISIVSIVAWPNTIHATRIRWRPFAAVMGARMQ